MITGWGHPSPLQTYFYQNEIGYPFEQISTANYRGHIAVWLIKDDKLFLKEINTKKYKKLAEKYVNWRMKKKGSVSSKLYDYANNDYWKRSKPKKYGVKSKNENNNSNGVFADWFSGVIECRLQNRDDYEIEAIYFFHIRNGLIIEVEKVETWEDRPNAKLGDMNRDYIAFYYRLKNDTIYLDNKKCLLNTGLSKLSPIFQKYNNNFLDWPYNWENKVKNGAPNCTWLLENDTLFLKNIILQYGLRFDTIHSQN